MTEQQMRDEFEVWYAEAFPRLSLARTECGYYSDDRATTAFIAWQKSRQRLSIPALSPDQIDMLLAGIWQPENDRINESYEQYFIRELKRLHTEMKQAGIKVKHE